MKFQTEKSVLEAAVDTVNRAVSARATLPILAHILIRAEAGRLRLGATDLETSIQCEVPAQVLEEGSCTVPSRLFTEVVGELSDGVLTFGDIGAQVEVQCRQARFKVNSMSGEEYPTLPSAPSTGYTEMPQKLLRTALKSVAVAAATQEETRAVLQGVHMALDQSQAVFVATDGRRLAKLELVLPAPISPPQVAILPARAVGELQRLLKDTSDPIRFCLTGNQIFFQLGGTLICARLLDGKFPNYRNLLPAQFSTTVTLDRDLLLSAVRRALVMAQEKATPSLVRLEFKGDQVEVASNAPDRGTASDTLQMSLQGRDIDIAFNGRFLLDGLQTLTTPEVRLQMNEPASAALLRPGTGDLDYLYLLMPVRLQKDEAVAVGAGSASAS